MYLNNTKVLIKYDQRAKLYNKLMFSYLQFSGERNGFFSACIFSDDTNPGLSEHARILKSAIEQSS